MSDDESVPTVRDRLLGAGLSPGRIAEHTRAGRVHLDGEPTTDLNTLAPAGTRVVIWTE